MSKLAPDLFNRRFDDLLEIGRARLPSLAPDWTDHNLHDPGITFMELLAWVAEAQIYSLSRMRRDERAAYAALLGLSPRGPLPAEGLIWPDRNDLSSAAATVRRSMVIASDVAVHTTKSSVPTYRSTRKLLWVAGQIVALKTVSANGLVVDHTSTNARGDVSFFPFGMRAGPHDVLSLDFACSEDTGLFPPRRTDADDAFVSVGVRVDGAPQSGATAYSVSDSCLNSAIAVTLDVDNAQYSLPVTDTTQGFTRTGCVTVDISAVSGSPRQFTLTFRAPAGFARPPHVVRIDLNVVPIRQGRTITNEVFSARGLPDQVLELQEQSLRFGDGLPAPEVEVAEGGAVTRWNVRERLDECSPADEVFALDADAGRITLGNGVNGRLPPAGAQILVSYSVCDGAAGNAARNQKWLVDSLSDVLGVNLDPVTGGSAASNDIDQRREARRRSRDDHALVTSADIEAAARALSALEVARAIAVSPETGAPNVGTTTLIAMRARESGIEPAGIPETTRWLAEIERRLAPRLPLGMRLHVRAPNYVAFTISAHVEAAEGWDPAAVKEEVVVALHKRLTLVPSDSGDDPRKLGRGVSKRDLAAWIRSVPGVRRIIDLQTALGTGALVKDEVEVPKDGLPKVDLASSSIEVARIAPAGSSS